jgi:hypothetical protein
MLILKEEFMDPSRKTKRPQSPPHPLGVEGHGEWPYDNLDTAIRRMADMLQAGGTIEFILKVYRCDMGGWPHFRGVVKLVPGTLHEFTLTPTGFEYHMYVEWQRSWVPREVAQSSASRLIRFEPLQAEPPAVRPAPQGLRPPSTTVNRRRSLPHRAQKAGKHTP